MYKKVEPQAGFDKTLLFGHKTDTKNDLLSSAKIVGTEIIINMLRSVYVY